MKTTPGIFLLNCPHTMETNNYNTHNPVWFPPNPRNQPPPYFHYPNPYWQWFQEPLTYHQPPLPPLPHPPHPTNQPPPHLHYPNPHWQWFQEYQQPPLPPLPFQFSGLPGLTMPMAQQSQQYQHLTQYQPPSSGPWHNQHNKGRHKMTEAQYTNQFTHVPSGTTTRGYPTGIHPVHAQMNASNNTRAGWVWRPPSGNPSMVSRYATQDVRVKPYKTDRAARKLRKKHIHKTDLSVYQLPITASGSRLI